jgi:cbb3-type cytochrome oxidase maturation protein
MEVLVILVPLALSLGLAGLAAFLWALKSGQYEDLDGAAWRAIADDDDVAAQVPAGEAPLMASPASYTARCSTPPTGPS